MKFILFMGALFIGSILVLHAVLQNGSLLKYLDAHPDPRWVPAVEYSIAQGYYMCGDLENSTTFFSRVAARYPDAPQADDAYFLSLQCQDDLNASHHQLADEYSHYLERFPQGKHAEVAQHRADNYHNSR